MERAVAILAALTVGALAGEASPEVRDLEAPPPLFEPIPFGAGVPEMLAAAARLGWECGHLQPAEFEDDPRHGPLECSARPDGFAVRYELVFHRNQLVLAHAQLLEVGRRREALAKARGTRLTTEAWIASLVSELDARYGSAREAQLFAGDDPGRGYAWDLPSQEIALYARDARDQDAIYGLLRRDKALAARIRAAERASPERDRSEGIPYGRMVAEVYRNLRGIRAAELAYRAEFGSFVAAAAHPPRPPSGAESAWGSEASPGFETLAFSPKDENVVCSYAVSVGPENCGRNLAFSPEEGKMVCSYDISVALEDCARDCTAFTAVAVCDPKGDGDLAYWGWIEPAADGGAEDGPFGRCRAEGVFSPDTGERIGTGRFGRCRSPAAEPIPASAP